MENPPHGVLHARGRVCFQRMWLHRSPPRVAGSEVPATVPSWPGLLGLATVQFDGSWWLGSFWGQNGCNARAYAG